MQEQLTREQLVKAMTEYYRQAFETPDDFYDTNIAHDPAEVAAEAVDYIFQIAYTQGA